jgi:hypothetical protein
MRSLNDFDVLYNFLVFIDLGDDSLSHIIAEGSIDVRSELPEHDARIPFIVGVVVLDGLIQVSCRHPSIVAIGSSRRLAQHNLFFGYASSYDLVDGASRTPISRLVEESMTIFIDTLSLIVKLDIVKVNKVTHCLMDCNVASLGVQPSA